MATLPTLNGKRPTARASISGGVSANAFAAPGRALEGLGGDIFNMGAEWEEREGALLAKEREVEFATNLNSLLSNPETGFLHSQGQNAVTGYKGLETEFKRLKEEALRGLPRQVQETLGLSLESRILSATNRVSNHVSAARRTWETNASNARIALTYEDALAGEKDLENSSATIEREFREQAIANGWSDDVLKVKILEGQGKLYSDRALEILNGGSAETALAFVNANAEKFVPSDLADVRARIEPKAKAERGRRLGAAAALPEISESYLASIRQAESGGNDAAANPNSTAVGRYQFLEGTWADVMARHPYLGLTKDGRLDPNQQERAIRAFTNDNAKILQASGFQPTNGNLYAAHFLGVGDAVRVLKSGGDQELINILSPGVISANSFLKGMTVSQFQNWAARKGGGSQVAVTHSANPSAKLLNIPDVDVRAAALRELNLRESILQDELAKGRREFQAAFEEEIAYIQANGAPAETSEFSAVDANRFYEPEQAQEVIRQYENAVTQAEMISGLASESWETVGARITSLQEKVAEPGRTDEDVNNLNSYLKAVEVRSKAIGTDAAKYLSDHNPPVRDLLAGYEEAQPENRAAFAATYADALGWRYDRLGVPKNLRNLLPVSMAKGYADQFNAMSPDVVAQTLLDFRNEWGGNAPIVMSQLSKEGLAAEYAVAMRHWDDPGLAAEIAGLRGATEAELSEGLPTGYVTDLSAELNEGVQEYRAVFEAGDVTGQATETFNLNYGVAKRLALKYTREGMDPNQAAEKVIERMFPEEVVNEPDMRLILPEDMDARGVVPSLDMMRTEKAIREWGPMALDDPRLPDFADTEIVIASAASRGVWLNNSDATGAVLHLNVGGYLLPLTNEAGEEYEMLFGDPVVKPRSTEIRLRPTQDYLLNGTASN